MRGISSEEIFVGGELTGYYDENGEWSPNELVSLAAYSRAGANGPDAWSDAVTGSFGLMLITVAKCPPLRQNPGLFEAEPRVVLFEAEPRVV